MTVREGPRIDLDDLIAYLRDAGAGEYSHGRTRVLIDHLTGTRDILKRWHEPEYLQLAGLLHSVYGTEVYTQQLLVQREEVRKLAGERAERLAYLFGVVPRRRLFAAVEDGRGGEELLAPSVADGSMGQALTRREADELVLLHAANLAEQARTKRGTGEWLARVGRLGRLLVGSSLSVPPVLAALGGVTPESEGLARQRYATALAGSADVTAAERQLARVLAACPALPEPYVWLAWISLIAEDWAAAEWWSETAAMRLAELATPWDKRLSFEEWSEVIDRIRARAQVQDVAPAGVPPGPRRLLEGLRNSAPAAARSANGAGADNRQEFGRQRFHRYMDTFAMRTGDVRRRHYPDLEVRPFHDPADFPVAAYLEDNFAAIKAEILGLDQAGFHPEAESIKREGSWDVLFFYDRGRRNEQTCAACPTLAHALDSFPTMLTLPGLTYVSRMRSGTHIAAHRGPTNFRLRCHLGVVVPDGDCAIRTGGETRNWQEGRCLVLDDHFEHEAWNHTDSDRIVIVMDLWHSGLTEIEVNLLTGLHRYAYRYAQRQHRWWTAHYPSDGTA